MYKVSRYEEGLEKGIENSKYTDENFGCLVSLGKGKEKVGCTEEACISLKDGDGKAPSRRSLNSAHAVPFVDDLLQLFQVSKQPSKSSACDVSSGSAMHQWTEMARAKNKSVSLGIVPGEYNKAEDWSPESEEDAQEFDEDDNSGFIMPTEMEQTKYSARVNNINLALSEENIVDGCESLTQELVGISPSKQFSRPTGAPNFQMADLEGVTSMHGTGNGHSNAEVEDGMGSDKACSCTLSESCLHVDGSSLPGY